MGMTTEEFENWGAPEGGAAPAPQSPRDSGKTGVDARAGEFIKADRLNRAAH